MTPTSREGNVLDMMQISSAEGRGHIKSLFRYDDGTAVPIRYVDKERIQDWLNVNRLQLPLHNLGPDSIDRISQLGEESKQNVSTTDKGERYSVSDTIRNMIDENADMPSAEVGAVPVVNPSPLS